jgi:ABC-type glutathione transport system ATPase component
LINNNNHNTLLKAQNISKYFISPTRKGVFSKEQYRALRDVDIEISPGEKVGLIGRSGSGKSTLIRCLAKLIEPDSGSINFKNTEITNMTSKEFKPFRKYLQVLFQNNYSTLNPGMKIGQMLQEAARLSGQKSVSLQMINEQMQKVSLPSSLLGRYPKELSGGECRRIGVAIIDLLSPELLLADEPVTALDYINKCETISLFERLNQEKGTAILFATHDLEAMAGFISRVIVLFGGAVVEKFPFDRLWQTRHPHTLELVRYHGFLKNMFTEKELSSYNKTKEEYAIENKDACVFVNYCQRYRLAGKPEACRKSQPALEQIEGEHYVACHYRGEVIE